MRISHAESLVMAALWRRAPLGADEITLEIAAEQGWGEATVKSLLNRLLKKKAVAATRDGRRYLYRPLIAKADYALSESESLLGRLFDGRMAPLVTQFADRGRLTPEDVAALKRLVEELDDGC